MSSKIILKKSSVLGKIPQPADLEFGEVALNYADGKLYFKNTSSNVQSISAGALGVDSASTIALINEYVDSAWITDRVGPIPTQGVDSASTISLIDTYVDSAYVQDRIDKTYINSLDVNAGTLDGQDGIYFLDYNNFTNTPNIPDSAYVAAIAAATPSTVDSAQLASQVSSLIDSDFVQGLVNENYVATIVDSQYIALRVSNFANAFGTIAVTGALSVVADAPGDTLTLAAGANVQISTDINTDTITISAAPTAQGLDFGTFTQPAGFGLDLGTF